MRARAGSVATPGGGGSLSAFLRCISAPRSPENRAVETLAPHSRSRRPFVLDGARSSTASRGAVCAKIPAGPCPAHTERAQVRHSSQLRRYKLVSDAHVGRAQGREEGRRLTPPSTPPQTRPPGCHFCLQAEGRPPAPAPLARPQVSRGRLEPRAAQGWPGISAPPVPSTQRACARTDNPGSVAPISPPICTPRSKSSALAPPRAGPPPTAFPSRANRRPARPRARAGGFWGSQEIHPTRMRAAPRSQMTIRRRPVGPGPRMWVQKRVEGGLLPHAPDPRTRWRTYMATLRICNRLGGSGGRWGVPGGRSP